MREIRVQFLGQEGPLEKGMATHFSILVWGFPGGSDGKASAYSAGDPGSISGSGRSPREGNGSPLQYACLENPMDGGTWQATIHGVTKSRTRLSEFTSLHLEKLIVKVRDLPGCPVVNNLPANAPGRFHVPRSNEGSMPQVLKPIGPRAHAPQQEKPP